MNKMNTLIAVVVGFCTMMGTAFTIDSRYAKVDEIMEKINKD